MKNKMYYYMAYYHDDDMNWKQIPVRSIKQLKEDNLIIVQRDEFLDQFKIVRILPLDSFQNREKDIHCWMNIGDFKKDISPREYDLFINK